MNDIMNWTQAVNFKQDKRPRFRLLKMKLLAILYRSAILSHEKLETKRNLYALNENSLACDGMILSRK